MKSSDALNVTVRDYRINDNPFALEIDYEVGGRDFQTIIRYNSITSLDVVAATLTNDATKNIVLSVIIWDAMRYLALGGSKLIVPKEFHLTAAISDTWSECFRAQFGEWRYLNKIQYDDGGPELKTGNNHSSSNALDRYKSNSINQERQSTATQDRHLITNGGGKDSLVGMRLLTAAKTNFDIYEGYLPIGGPIGLQMGLLKRLRDLAAPKASRLRTVEITDNLYTLDDDEADKMGVVAKHFRTDFAVGHTANYPGYFPLIAAHGYSHIWFNIEASSDRSMVKWQGEEINHQWCKSRRFHTLASALYRNITSTNHFSGFYSTLRGLHDTRIYQIASSNTHLLKASHSCNYGKPWCCNCPKCTFCYLMMSAESGEKIAQEVMGITYSIFEREDNYNYFSQLLNKDLVAWECVADHDECQLALLRCKERGIQNKIVEDFLDREWADRVRADGVYTEINWLETPSIIRDTLFSYAASTSDEINVPVLIVGAGQSGLALSFELKSKSINHIVIERDMIGSSWMSRWDNFQINTPNKTIHLPGTAYASDDPHGFMTAKQVQNFLREYAHAHDLPVQEGISAYCVEKTPKGFVVSTNRGRIRCQAIVAATGEYCSPRTPDFREAVPNDVAQLHSSEYRNANELADGDVLVIGGGQSGAQIVEDIIETTGKRVFWSLSDRPSNCRRIGDYDFMDLWDASGILHNHVMMHPEWDGIQPHERAAKLRELRSREFPLVSGKGEQGLGGTISLEDMIERGVILVPKTDGFTNRSFIFRKSLSHQLARAVEGSKAEHKHLQDGAARLMGVSPETLLVWCKNNPGYVPKEIFNAAPRIQEIATLNIDANRIRTIIYATGFHAEWPWLTLERLFDEVGYPLGIDGVSPIEGIFFLGLFNLQRLSSTCLCNGGRDARELVPQIEKVLGQLKDQTCSGDGQAKERRIESEFDVKRNIEVDPLMEVTKV